MNKLRASSSKHKEQPGLRYHIPREHQPFAADWRHSRGRMFSETASATRSDYQRDRDRIIHSTAFRRLKHKTQVFIEHEGDHYRTRLTHTIEVAQIARSIARALGLDEDLAEAIALAHDLGHTPFGHTGEDALDACLFDHGGFDHNAQALRIVTVLERRYGAYDGLNLTFETLEGIIKHNGPLLDQAGQPMPRHANRGVADDILSTDRAMNLRLAQFASAEAQAAAIADDIAYNAHDIDDGLRAGLLDLGALADNVPLIAELKAEIDQSAGALDRPRLIHEIQRRVITRFVEDAIREAEHRIDALNPKSRIDIERASKPMIAFSPAFEAHDKAIKAYLFPSLYRHQRMMKLRAEAAGVVADLFSRFMKQPETLPSEWAEGAKDDEKQRAVLVRDYIAGMTDRYALQEHRRLFDVTPELR
jgi:dGTPase